MKRRVEWAIQVTWEDGAVSEPSQMDPDHARAFINHIKHRTPHPNDRPPRVTDVALLRREVTVGPWERQEVEDQ